MKAGYACKVCENDIDWGEQYIKDWHGDMMCGNCIADSDTNDILDFMGYDSIFDMLHKLKELKTM
jgi:hypothetical protein